MSEVKGTGLLRYGVILTGALVLFWLGLSGYFKPMLLILGALSVVIVVILCARMRIFDKETAPYLYIPKTLAYFTWLGGEIFKANIAVVRAVLSPNMAISPTMVHVPNDRSTDMGASMFANSITLTPGTVSVSMEPGGILVHALLAEMAEPDDFTEMSARSGWSVGEPDGPAEASS